jgi:hypothetical protein
MDIRHIGIGPVDFGTAIVQSLGIEDTGKKRLDLVDTIYA